MMQCWNGVVHAQFEVLVVSDNTLMQYDESAEPSFGNVAKVFSATDDGMIFARFSNGHIVRWLNEDGPEVKRGDIVLFHQQNGWEVVGQDAWAPSNSVGVVEQVLPDGSVLVEHGSSLVKIENPAGFTLSAKDTIEYDVDGVLNKIDDTIGPIGISKFHRSHEVEAFEFESPDGGPGFDDFGGYPEVVERAKELISIQFERRKYLDQIGAKPIKGVLFTGPPGTGKTHLARIIAHEAKAHFTLISGPSVVSKWIGDSEELLRRIFEKAKASDLGRAIIFFDEIDSIADRRKSQTSETSNRMVAQLLTLMDGFGDDSKGVTVIAATNRANALDPALMRPGRFDWEIQFGMPTEYDRLQILRAGSRRLSVSNGLPLSEIARASEGWSPAEVASLWSEAALVAAGERRGQIAGEDLARAFERVSRRPRRRYETEGAE
jgi:transitional endoplasmic reticulum ATPase